jgi:hypothetical protein
MSKNVRMRFVQFALVIGLTLTGLVAASHVTAQNVLTGNWTATLDDDKSKINLNFDQSREQGHKHQIGHTYDFVDLQGLSSEDVRSGGPVKFSLVREAGRIDCEGSFQNGKGAGTFRFTGNQAFVSAMKSRGFDFDKDSNSKDEHVGENRLFTATGLNITTALADDLASAGFGKLDVDDLFKAAIFKIDSAFMREMKATGFPNLGMEELVKARIFKIDAKLVSEVTQMGFNKEPFESLVKMQIFKISPAFIAEVRNEGLTDVSIEELVKLSIFKIDGEFIRKAKAEGVPLEVERLVQKRLGVAQKRAM